MKKKPSVHLGIGLAFLSLFAFAVLPVSASTTVYFTPYSHTIHVGTYASGSFYNYKLIDAKTVCIIGEGYEIPGLGWNYKSHVVLDCKYVRNEPMTITQIKVWYSASSKYLGIFPCAFEEWQVDIYNYDTSSYDSVDSGTWDMVIHGSKTVTITGHYKSYATWDKVRLRIIMDADGGSHHYIECLNVQVTYA